MRARSAWQNVLFVTGSLVLAGCHTYRPVEVAPVGSAVRVHILVTSALVGPNAPTPTVAVEGDLLSSGDTLVLATRTRRQYGAFREIIRVDTVRVAPDQRAGLDLVEFSPGRSVALGVGLTLALAGIAGAAFGGLTGGNSEEPPSGPVNSVVVGRSVLSTIWGVIAR